MKKLLSIAILSVVFLYHYGYCNGNKYSVIPESYIAFTGIGSDGNVMSELVLVPREYSQENTPYECQSIGNHRSIIEINPSSDWSRVFNIITEAQAKTSQSKADNANRYPRIEIFVKIKSLNGSPAEFSFSLDRLRFRIQVLNEIIQTSYRSTNINGLLIPLKIEELWGNTFDAYPALTEL